MYINKISFILIITIVSWSYGSVIPLQKLVQNEKKILSGEEIEKLSHIISKKGRSDIGISTDGSSSAKVDEDAFLTTPQLIRKYGYPEETHKVVTGDGYILEMHRIPRKNAQPVYLQHGILDSSGGWVVSGPQAALAYMLYDNGYDVWLGNVRGNRYGRSHINLSPSASKFWQFSFHEIAVVDVPAMIDYILQQTDYKKLHYVGHSQGTTTFYVMCSERPEYNDKILSMNSLAPVAFMQYIYSPFIRAVSLFTDQVESFLKIAGINEFLPSSELLALGGQAFCNDHAITQVVCYNVLFLITGYDIDQLNKTMLPAILGHIPAGASTKQLVHYGQLVNSGKFRMYDYGWFKNLFSYYGRLSPPDYDLSKVKAPVYLHYSTNDWLSDPKDVERLSKELGNMKERIIVPLNAFNHLDFLFAKDARDLLYNRVLKIMQKEEVVLT